jgi:predicted DNA-binding transcriptional regulator AlpA
MWLRLIAMVPHALSRQTMITKGKPSVAPRDTHSLSPADALLTAREFADGLRISMTTFRRTTKSGGIPAPIAVSPGCRRWPASDLRSMLEAQRKRR